jgi:hypothetical protein
VEFTFRTVTGPLPEKCTTCVTWRFTTTTLPSCDRPGTLPATTNDVGPVTQQLLGSMSALLTGRFMQGAAPTLPSPASGGGKCKLSASAGGKSKLRKAVEPIALAARNRRILYM